MTFDEWLKKLNDVLDDYGIEVVRSDDTEYMYDEGYTANEAAYKILNDLEEETENSINNFFEEYYGEND